MSSHHFVKENQEPSLWILGNHFNYDTIHQLLEWSPSVHAILPSSEILLSLQIKIDKIYYLSSQKELLNIYKTLYPIEFIETNHLEKLFSDELQSRPSHHYIIGLDLETLYKWFYNTPNELRHFLIGISANQKWISPPLEWSKWLPKGQKFSILGNTEDWEIIGNLKIDNKLFISENDQLILIKNLKYNCLIEYL
ncbi:MAG: hypothetical protein LC105_11895 [Chitinophagales bacterium]|nr:hypothetical protein [Chitinophagales bacterium]MCZ2394552.1 hypothetical protein [Chitinophagales bacterium]